MQTAAQQPAPALPVLAPAPASITTVGADGKTVTLAIPRTSGDFHELESRRDELSDQLSSVTDRRSELATEANNTPDVAIRAGLEERLRVLDRRILQLETDLAATGQQLAAAPSDLRASTETESADTTDNSFEQGVMTGGFSVLAFSVVVLFLTRRRWKRRRPTAPLESGSESSQRLERLEHGMEAIAIEIERVSEGQRFVTRLLSQSQPLPGTSHQSPQPVGIERDPAKQ